MCTVSLVRPTLGHALDADHAGLRFRLACNRDEQRTRTAALPPTLHTIHRVQSLMPIDPVSGGTWIAANQFGLTLTLMNLNPTCVTDDHITAKLSPPAHQPSRGLIIPSLLTHAHLSDLAMDMQQRNWTKFSPFRLLVADSHNLRVFHWQHQQLIWFDAPLDQPVMFTSSGLGDARVESPRRELFQHMVMTARDPLHQQAQFHQHSWPTQTHLSVCMRRLDACTVSHTQIEVFADHLRMLYTAGPPDTPTHVHEHQLAWSEPTA